MNKKIWSKTLLYAYHCFEKIIVEIDKNVLSCAINSSKIIGEEGTNRAFNHITKLTNRKLLLINLRVLIDEALSKMDKLDGDILRHKYIEDFSSDVSAKLLGVSQRTIFRRMDEALCEFSYYINLLKGSLDFDFVCKKETWLKEIYNRLMNKEVKKTFKKYSKEVDTKEEIVQAINAFENRRIGLFIH